MESRLPKPSAFKRPPAVRSNLPIGPSVENIFNQRMQQRTALTTLNIPRIPNKRHASPEIGSKPVIPSKLRRSRSACDLRRNVGTFEPVIARNIKSSMIIPTFRNNMTAATIKSKLTKSSSLISSSSSSLISLSTARSQSTKSTAKVEPKKTLPSNKQSTTTTAKRIPAYDYKARFLDLQEKHKQLKDKYDISQSKLNEFSTIGEQYERSEEELMQTKQLADQYKSENCNLKKEIQCHEIKIKALSLNVNARTQEVKLLQGQCDIYMEENKTMKPELLDLREKFKENQEQIEHLTKELMATEEQLFKSNCERKELHNVVMDLRGNIRVFCRVRPPICNEENRELCGWQYLDETSLEISTHDVQSRKILKHDFSFDQVFHPKSSQEDIFELVSPLIQSALDGFNVCIFAYGQTGSGKTFTMDGIQNDVGIIPRTVDLLFDNVKNYRRLGWSYEIRVTFLEIYNEVLYDLLSDTPKDMEIRMVSAKNPTEIYVSNITEVTVQSEDQLRELMSMAKLNRSTASTVGNERSSRSHAVTRIQLIGNHVSKNETCIGTINLVDLAGSESPKTSQRMEETKKINKSLSELTNVIMALLQRQEHIPYRNSKLTHLLMPCLGGNSKTLMFINVAPFHDCFSESVKSLRFAASVNSCKMTKAKKNKFLNNSNASLS